MSEKDKIERFNRELDALLDGEAGVRPGEDDGRLPAARRLASADFSGRSRLREATRARLLAGPGRRGMSLRLATSAAVLILAVAGVGWLVSNLPTQPALPAVQSVWGEYVIAYQSDQDGNAEIYRMDGGGVSPANLTRNPAADTSPAWSPDGGWIAFFSDRTGKNEVFVMDVNGGQVRQLTDAPDLYWFGPLAWSPDGTAIALTGSETIETENDARIYLVDVAAARARVFLPDSPAKTPHWLGSGAQLVFATHDNVADRAGLTFTLGESNLGLAEITVESEPAKEGDAQIVVVLGMDAAPDGNQVAFLALYKTPRPDSNLFQYSHAAIQTIDRSAVPIQTLLEIRPVPNGIMGLSWSPDGVYLAYLQSVGMSGCWHVHILRLADGERREVEDLCYTMRTREPDWTPDGRWLVYPADGDGSYADFGLVAVDIPGLFDDPENPIVHRLTKTDGTAHSPQVRPVWDAVQIPAEPTPTPPGTEAPALFPGKATVIVPGSDQAEANLRMGPGTSFPSAGTIATGTVVEVLAVSVDGEWYRIGYPGAPEDETWIYRDFLSFDTTGPLTRASSDAEIRERLRESIALLNTLWANVLVLTESKGETHTDRQQVWIYLPSQSRWMSGIDGSPPYQSQVTSAGQTVLLSADCERFESNATTLQIGDLDTVLFPAHFAARPGTFEAVREETVGGRLALVVEWHSSENRVEDRLWIDVETGVVLRWENLFPGYPDGAGQVEPLEIRIEEIMYGVDIPEGRFSLSATCGPDQEPPVPAVVAPGTGEVVVRSGPGTDFAVVGQVLEGDTVLVAGASETGDWLRILFPDAPDGVGWVYAELLELENATP